MNSLIALGLLVGCSPHRYVDDDDTCSRAKPLPPIVLVKDDLNVNMGDRTDCKQVKYFKDAVAKVEYRIGTAFEKHNLKGLITIYDSDGQVLDQKAVDPSVFKYDFEFDVVQQKPYYVEFKATGGAHAYQAQVRFEKKDPCAKCGPDQICVDAVDGGKICKTAELACAPECDPARGEICDAGRCIPACNPNCRRGYRCDVDTQECEKRVAGRCNPRCRRGQVCRGGRCRRKPPPDRCKGGCPPGKICRRAVCVTFGPDRKCPACPKIADKCDASTDFLCVGDEEDQNGVGPITGRVTSTVRAGNGSILYLNRGIRNGVKRGQRGKLCNKYKFTITNAFSTRARAKTNHTLEEIGDCKSVVIKR